jgi:hypothetical protein
MDEAVTRAGREGAGFGERVCRVHVGFLIAGGPDLFPQVGAGGKRTPRVLEGSGALWPG